MAKLAKLSSAVLVAAMFATTAVAQGIAFTPYNLDPRAANAAFPPQNANGPSGIDYQVNYPYPGQCLADPANSALFPTTPPCSTATSSFACVAPGIAHRTAGGWADCGVAPSKFATLNPMVPDLTAQTQKFVWELLNPLDYTPDKATYQGADYYEIGLHEAWGFQALAAAGVFPDPALGFGGQAVPNGMQWTGLLCNIAGGCTCPGDASPSFKGSYCTAAGSKIPFGFPLYTPVWGVGQINMGGGPVTATLASIGHCQITTATACNPTVPSTCPIDPATALPETCVAVLSPLFTGPAAPWSANNYVATWPSISIRANKGTPVVVKWQNEFPNGHVLCPHADAADWPCSIDRTFMGVKARIDPATAGGLGATIVPDGVNIYGGPQQPDNSWVTHLHGGEIPPSTDGFAEKWFGNAVTAPLYTPPGGKLVNPPFEHPAGALAAPLLRPAGNFDTYTYPMVQEEATIWFHDHTLGKTHHNVIAGPAGFFPVKEPLKHGGVLNGAPTGACPAGYAGCTTEYTWLDPVTEPRGALTIPMYDLFLAVQDRAFNDDGSINFSNGLGQTMAGPPLVPGMTPVTPGVNPLVHPTWVPEYFGDYALVNGVLWPKKTTEPGWYRIRLVDGSDSRCYTFGFQTQAAGSPAPAPGAAVAFNTPFWVIASDQGYLPSPVLASKKGVTMCPGERYEILVNFGALPGLGGLVLPGGAADVYMVNNAPAPFPGGLSPQQGMNPDLNVIMKFAVSPANGPGIKSCGQVSGGKARLQVAPAGLTWDPNNMAQNLARGAWPAAPGNYSNICMPANPALVVAEPAWAAKDLRSRVTATTTRRQLYLNERVDGLTLAPMGMQLNGVPFEYKVTETPRVGNLEVWDLINLTVDAHPMHPHLVAHQIIQRQNLNVGAYKRALCGSATCQPGPAPGGEMQVVPNPADPLVAALGTTINPVTTASPEGGFKDATQVPPGFVTTIVARWGARWAGSGDAGFPAGAANAPGTAGCPNGRAGCGGPPWTYETVTSGPYVWHCHINSHEDSEMMRTSLVVGP